MKKFYKIGDVSKIYNISTDILRYYEKIGLLIPDSRKENGYRYYSEKQLWKLSNIRNLRKLGVGLKEITEFLETRSITKTEKMIDFQLEKIDKTIEQLLLLKSELENKKNNIISKELSKNLQRMVGFRNIAVHDYQAISLDILQKIIENHLEDALD